VFVPRERAGAVADSRAERESAAESRVAAIGMWIELRLGDAKRLAGHPSVLRLLKRQATASGNEESRREVSRSLSDLVAGHGIDRAFVLDGSLSVAASDAAAGAIGEPQIRVARAALEGGRPKADLVPRAGGRVEALFAFPVLDRAAGSGAGTARGVVLLAEDPDRWLYPYLTQRLGASATSESLVVRRDGDEALFLSPLRHDPAPPLTVRRSLSLPGLAAAEGVRGRETFGEFVDYRGAGVFAALRRIPGTDWVMVAKIDRDEALERFHWRLRALGFMSFLLASALVALALITQRAHRADRRAEVARTEARLNERFRIAAESVSDVVYEWDLGDRVEWLGDVDGLLGWGPGEYPRTAAGHVASIHPEDLDRVMAAVERHRRGEAPYEVEYRVQRKDGSYAWWAVRGTAVRDAGGRPVHWIGAITDVSRRKADEEHLLHLNAVLRAIRSVNQVIAREKDARRLLSLVCESLAEWRGYRGAWMAVVGGHDAGHLASAGIDAHVLELRARFERGDPPECARRAIAEEGVHSVLSPRTECRDCPLAEAYRDGAGMAVRVAPGGRLLAVLCVSVSARFARDDEERALLQEVAGDIGLALQAIEGEHERRRAVEALAASERKYRHFFEQDLAGHYVSTREGRLVACNSAFARLLGFPSAEAAVGSDVVSLYATPAARDAFLEKLRAEGRVDRLETELRRRDGGRLWVIESAVEVEGTGTSPGEIHGFIVDDTDRRTAREELLQAQKMEAVGRLAGGVAHDFNNLLGVILGHAELLRLRLGPHHTGASALEQVRLAAERGARLTRQLLAFSRRQVLQPRVLDLNAVIRGMEPMLGRLLGEDVQLVTALEEGLGRVRADEGQVEQVLMNLAVNARDAMPQGGTLTIRTANAGPDDGDPLLGTEGARRVTITVSDSGHGMDGATLSRAFEPFFTTKATGEGTGLGLATVYGIVQQSGGTIEVESAPSKGATFRISLPRVEGEVQQASAPPPGTAGGGGAETLLLVEDDPALRAVTREVLEGAGYRVHVASRAEEALAVSEAHPAVIDLLLSDVVMPGRSGPELAAELLARRPGLRVLYTSGYTSDAIARHGLQEAGVRLLQKPFSPSDLLRAVREALDEPLTRAAARGPRAAGRG
jgi:two-component system cell cycle sensor histidine kinase/response regulator CckA